jgi:UDP-2,3-diacylglucosamine pyrophosphatase LpxH
MKTLIMSDSHIGLPESNYPAVMDFFDLAQDRADELILLGDIFETWLNTWENITTQQPYKEAYEKLIETSRTVPVTITTGNHDYDLKRHIKNPNIIINDGFTRDNIRFEHGWKLDVLQLAASPLYEWILTHCPYLYQRYFYHPQKLKLSQNDLINDRARDDVEKQGYKMLVYGHLHTPFIDGKLVNCGDFVKHTSYIVIENENPKLKYI